MSVRVLSPLALALLLAACGGEAPSTASTDGSSATDSNAPVETASPEDVDVFELAVGDCLADNTEGQVSENTKVDCATPHLTEVYHLFNLPEGDFPAPDVLSQASEQGCLAQFEGYVGLDFESSEFTISTLTPTVESWADGDREVVCLLATQDGGTITGSLRNAKR